MIKLTLISTLFFIVGCSEQPLTCINSSDSVLNISQERLTESYGSEYMSKVKLEISNARNTDESYKADLLICAANISTTVDDDKNNFLINFTINTTNEDKDTSISVYGL